MAKQKKVKEKKFEIYDEDEETNKIINEILNDDDEDDASEEEPNGEVNEALQEAESKDLKKSKTAKVSGVKKDISELRIVASKVYYQGRLIQLIDKFLNECYYKSSAIEDYSFFEIQKEYQKAINKFVKLIDFTGEGEKYNILFSAYSKFYEVYFLDEEEYVKKNGKFKFDYKDESRKNAIFSYACFLNCYGIMLNFACVDLESYYKLANCSIVKNNPLFGFVNSAIVALKAYIVAKNKKQIATRIDDKILTKVSDNVIEHLQCLRGWEDVYYDKNYIAKAEDAYLNFLYSTDDTKRLCTKIEELVGLKKSDVYDISLTAIQREVDKRFANKNIDQLNLDMFAYRHAKNIADNYAVEARAGASNLAMALKEDAKSLFSDFEYFYKESLKYKPDDYILFYNEDLVNAFKEAFNDILNLKRVERAEKQEKEKQEKEDREKKRFEALSKRKQKKELKQNAKWDRKHKKEKEKEEKKKQRKERKKEKRKEKERKRASREKIKYEKPHREHKNIFAGFEFNAVAKFAIIVIVASILLCVANYFGLFTTVAEYIHEGSRFCFKHFHKMPAWTNWAIDVLSADRGFWAGFLLVLPLILLFLGTFIVELVWTIVWGIIIIIAGVLLIILSGVVSFLPVVMAIFFAVWIIVTCVKKHSSSWDAFWVIISLALCVLSVVLFFHFI